MNEKRQGGVGDAWNGLLGDQYETILVDLISHCVKNPRSAGKEFDEHVLIIDPTHVFSLQELLKKTEKRILFQSIVPHEVNRRIMG